MKSNVSINKEKKTMARSGYGPWAFLVDNKFAG
jgi:hypothetical protein